jgi:hypothetical protein
MNTLELSEELMAQLVDYIKSFFLPGHEICSREWFNNNLSVEYLGGNEYLVHDKLSGNYLIINI